MAPTFSASQGSRVWVWYLSCMCCSVSSQHGHMQTGTKNADDVTMHSCCNVYLGVCSQPGLGLALSLAGPEHILVKAEHALCFLVFSKPCFASPIHVPPSGRLQLLLWSLSTLMWTDSWYWLSLCLLIEWNILGGNWSILTFIYTVFLLPTSKFLWEAESTDSVMSLLVFKSYLNHFTSYVKLDKLYNLSVPQFYYLLKWNNNSTYLIGLLWVLNELLYLKNFE